MKPETKKDTIVLAIETASEACSAALLVKHKNAGIKIYKQIESTPRQHAKRILSMLDMVLNEAEVELKDVDAIAFGRGPGAFTGLRIAAGVAQGVALSVDKPVVPVSTLAALALEVVDKVDSNKHKNQIIATALDARMGEVYWGLFRLNNEGHVELLGEEQVSTPEEMLQSILDTTATLNDCRIVSVGAGWDAYHETLFRSGKPDNLDYLESIFPVATAVAQIGLSLFNSGEMVAPEDAQPVYIRNDVAKKSQKQ